MPEQSKKQKREEAVAADLSEFLQKNSAELLPSLSFPVYNKLPIELELAVAIVKKHEPQFDIQVVIKDDEPAQQLQATGEKQG